MLVSARAVTRWSGPDSPSADLITQAFDHALQLVGLERRGAASESFD
jgi:hypothetical protein